MITETEYEDPSEVETEDSVIELAEEDPHQVELADVTEEGDVLEVADATEGTEEAGKDKPKLELKRVDTPAAIPLKVNMARQVSEFFTGPHWPKSEQLTKPFNYVLQPDGLWEIRNVQAGWLIRRRDKFTAKLPGFITEEHSDTGIPRYGKVPPDLYWQIVSFFKEICNDSGDEVYVQTFWDPEENKYFNHVPKQIVSGASVRYERDQELEDRCPLVVETHSHNNMSAFFSVVDNADEKSDRFFGVMGKLGTTNPEVLYSFLCGGVRTNIPVSDVFDLGHNATFPAGWKGQVTRNATIAPTSWGSYQVGSAGNQGSVRRYGPGKATQLGGPTKPWKKPHSKAKEAQEEIEAAAARAEAEVGDGWTTEDFLSEGDGEEGGQRPFFQVSSKGFSTVDKLLVDTVHELIIAFSKDGKGDEMSEEEREELFLGLVSVLTDEDVGSLASVLTEQGYGEHLLEALDAPDEFEDTEEEVEEEGEAEEEVDDENGPLGFGPVSLR